MNTIIIVDPIRSGKRPVDAATRLSFSVLSVMTLSRNLLSNLGVYEADYVCDLDTSQRLMFLASDSFQAVINYVEEMNLKIAAVIPATDPGIVLADRLGCFVGVIHNDPQASLHRIHKGEMQKAIRRFELLQPQSICIHTLAELVLSINTLRYPVVAKPPCSAGTDHIYICNSLDEVINSFQTILEASTIFGRKSDDVVLEEYVFWQEYAVNLYAENGKQYLIDIIEYAKYDNIDGKNIYHSAKQLDGHPTELSALIQYTKDVAVATGIRFGPSHVEIRMSPTGPQLMEVGPRFPGVEIPNLWAESLSFDPFRVTVETFLGRSHKDELSNLSFSKFYRIEFCGQNSEIEELQEIGGIDSIVALDSYYNHKLSVSIGQQVPPSINLATIPLLVKLMNSNQKQLASDAEFCHQHFYLK